MTSQQKPPDPEDPKPASLPSVTPASDPFGHLSVGDPAAAERQKAEFAARMAESARRWPGRRKSVRRRRR